MIHQRYSQTYRRQTQSADAATDVVPDNNLHLASQQTDGRTFNFWWHAIAYFASLHYTCIARVVIIYNVFLKIIFALRLNRHVNTVTIWPKMAFYICISSRFHAVNSHFFQFLFIIPIPIPMRFPLTLSNFPISISNFVINIVIFMGFPWVRFSFLQGISFPWSCLTVTVVFTTQVVDGPRQPVPVYAVWISLRRRAIHLSAQRRSVRRQHVPLLRRRDHVRSGLPSLAVDRLPRSETGEPLARQGRTPQAHWLRICQEAGGQVKSLRWYSLHQTNGWTDQHTHLCHLFCTFKARTERRNWTELTWTELARFIFWQTGHCEAVMHYSRHRLTASLAYVTTPTYASTNDQLARSGCPLVSLSKTKPCQFSSVQLRRSVRAFKLHFSFLELKQYC